jgi:DNA-binding FrmR family transcriptional regulator
LAPVGDREAAVHHARRVSGQVAALAAMIGEGRRLPVIAQQVVAARASLDSLLLRLVEIELHDCLPSPAARDEVDGVLRAALGRPASGRAAIRVQPTTQAPRTARSHKKRTS